MKPFFLILGNMKNHKFVKLEPIIISTCLVRISIFSTFVAAYFQRMLIDLFTTYCNY